MKSLIFSSLYFFLGIAISSLPMEPVLAQTNQSRQHTKIPSIYGLEYEQARQKLIAAGWQPQKQHWTYRNELWNSSGREWWDKGYWEIENCSGGLVYCSFYFRDVYGNRLLVTTQGQVNATVNKWTLENSSQSHQSRQHSSIPSLYALEYAQARRKLIAEGWQPQKQHWTHKDELWNSVGREWWDKGYWEIENCSEGLVYCSFYFRDVYGDRLLVRTQGQDNAKVAQWSLE
ncbi:hypothetical protein [Picosynechococcus sp. PCC 73109]|uniref:hypothetical protein n=1 Tax=Picosynechococcus sp. PCC 73109 TaxID=374982 RepID=UPI0007458BB8|nr:hypothetical protein [Picosynechococcus sp. PCC 73109]AMA07984.1 hypothetical protein AWQ23_00875 [Picosynechococcus sp. PCC 73109]